MLHEQRRVIAELSESIDAQVRERPDDMVTLWRGESSKAALRFLDVLEARGA